jgi:hypothetical protein
MPYLDHTEIDNKLKPQYPRSIPYIGFGMAVLPLLVLSFGEALGIISPTILFAQTLILSVIGLVALRIALRGGIFHYSPFLLVLLFLLSYPLRILDLELDPASRIRYITGSFPFTADAHWELVFVASVGMVGMMSGIASGQFLLRSWLSKGRLIPFQMRQTNNNQVDVWIWIWFVVALGANLLAQIFGIGALTLYPVELPFKLTGFLTVIRPYLFPLVGLWLFGLALQHKNRGAVIRLLVMNGVLGILSIVTTLSKGAAFWPFVPYALCLWMIKGRSFLSRSVLRWTIVIIIVAAPVSIIGASWFRLYTLQTGVRPSLTELVNGGFGIGDVLGESSLVETLYTHTFRRELGASEAMAVVSGQPLDLLSQLSLAVSAPGWPDIQSRAISNVFGFNDWASRAGGFGPVTGKGYGLFGFWYLSHSLVILFLGSFFSALLVLLIEGIIRRFGNAGLSAGVCFTLTDLIWSYASDIIPWFLLNIAIMFVVLYLFQRYSSAPQSAEPRTKIRYEYI